MLDQFGHSGQPLAGLPFPALTRRRRSSSTWREGSSGPRGGMGSVIAGQARAAAATDTQDNDQDDAHQRDRCRYQRTGPADAGVKGARYGDAAEADGGEGHADGEPGDEVAIGSPRGVGVHRDGADGAAAVEGKVCKRSAQFFPRYGRSAPASFAGRTHRP